MQEIMQWKRVNARFAADKNTTPKNEEFSAQAGSAEQVGTSFNSIHLK